MIKIKEKFASMFSSLQLLGRSLMLPVAILPVAGLLLGIGGAILSGIERQAIHLDSPILILLFTVFRESGAPIFGNLPLIFAIGTSLGFTKNDGAAALAATVGYFVMLSTMGVVGNYFGHGSELKMIAGINSIDTGVFGGIILGILTAKLFNKYSQIKLPSYLGFFGGKRFVPIITSLMSIVLGFVLSFAWPPVAEVISSFSMLATKNEMGVTVFIYGFVERLLIPFGLHHIWNVPFFFEIGEYVTKNGQVVHGELTRFFNGDPNAGNLAGGYLFKMFGLPAAAIAIWKTSLPENQVKVGGIMLSAALTSFITGITEPIEFSFLFIAPVLYGLHALLAGLAFPLLYYAGIKMGYTFSHGLIDLLLFYPMDTRPYYVFFYGPLYFFIYYFLFKYSIEKFNLKTPGRETNLETDAINHESDVMVCEGEDQIISLAKNVIKGIGEQANINTVEACITRLRVNVKDEKKVDKLFLKNLGATEVLSIGKNFQIIFGTKSELIKDKILTLLNLKNAPDSISEELKANSKIESFYENSNLQQIFGGKNNIKSIMEKNFRMRVEVISNHNVDMKKLSMEYPSFVKVSENVYHLI